MIDNSGKIALIFGVRNDSSIAWNIARALFNSGSKVAFTYIPETEADVRALLVANGMENALTCKADAQNDIEITECIERVYREHGAINYIMHGIAYERHKLFGAAASAATEAAPCYLDVTFDDLVESFNSSTYSLLRICRMAERYLSSDASILSLTYNSSQVTFPGYTGATINKAAFENIIVYLAKYFGTTGVRINALSTGLAMTTADHETDATRRGNDTYTAPLSSVKATDVENAALYYFSSLSKRVTGNIHAVAGGFNVLGATADRPQVNRMESDPFSDSTL